ncbi:FGGY family carbohydrate kinase [Microbacterium halotolerans]|uniref:FGGY family carbohydrate kinase n=1 Tax=Microbacterium halotolerans TaxID=246613 RepID=UPI0013C2A1E4|nr:FGGY family carbohydrate kinase [Microbacterium halotolerans]
MTTPVFLAIDAGTGSARALAFDADGRLVAHAHREWSHAAVEGHPGGTVFDTDEGWHAVSGAVRDVADALAGAYSVASVAASSMREGFVLYDRAGVELWACPNTDGRARREADELVVDGTADDIYRIAGDWVSITAPARIRWIARHEPELLTRAAHLGMLSDWVATRLTGEFTTEPTCGSSSALFDLSERDWSGALADRVGIDSAILPDVVECGERIGSVTPTAAAATGLPVGTPVVAGGADTQLALHGIGAQRGRPTIVGGTFWQTTSVIDRPLVDPERRLRTLCHVEPGQWMIEGIGFLSGLAMRWFRDAFCGDAVAAARDGEASAFAVMEEWAAEIPPGANGVLALLADTMQADAWHHTAPTFTGFDITDQGATGRGAFIRAIEEAAAYIARDHVRILSEITSGAATATGEVTFTGGSSAGRLWPEIIAGTTGLDVRVTPAPEATSYGAARLAARGVGADLAPMSTPQRTITASEYDIAQYNRASAKWRRAYDASRGISSAGVDPLFVPPGAARAAGATRSATTIVGAGR